MGDFTCGHRWLAVFALAAVLVLSFFAIDRYSGRAASPSARIERRADGRVVQRTVPDGRVARYIWDDERQLVRISYHRLGRVTGHAYVAGDEVRFAYDAAGNRTAVDDGTGATRYQYDDLARPSMVTASGKTLTYAYDPWQRIRRLTYPDGTALEYEHDIFGRIVRVREGRHELAYEYRSDGAVRRLPNGVETTYARSQNGQLTSITHRRRDQALIADYRYEYDNAGRVVSVTETTGRTTTRIHYGYDRLGRLVRVDDGSGTTLFGYDALGNRVSEKGSRGERRYDYDRDGRLVRAGDVQYRYDTFGNVVAREGGGRAVEYAYDAEGRLVEVKTNGKTVQYAYDGEGHRVARVSAGIRTHLLHHRFAAAPPVLFEHGERSTTRYVIGVSRIAQTDGSGRPLYFLEDHLGSTRILVGSSGEIVARYDYSAFGAPQRKSGGLRTRFLFAGEEWDDETGLLYLRARHYDPEIGRFLTPDPLDGRPDDPQSYNLYAYSGNDPVNRIDPLGLQSYRPPWKPPPPPPPPYWAYDRTRYDIYGHAHTYTNPGGMQPLPGDHHWTWYFPSEFLGAAWRGELLHPTAPWQNVIRAGLTFHPGAGLLIMTSDFSYYMHRRDPMQAGLSVLPTLLGMWLEQRVPGAGGRISTYIDIFGAGMEIHDSGYLYDATEWFYRNNPDARDPLEYAARFDPLVAGSLERTRNIFFPPPGGGGGALPLVGGVYLDQTAKVIGELGTIVGATWDPASGRLILAGDRNASLPPMRSDYLAAALRAVYTDSPHEPGMTIDPHPENPHAP